MVRISDGCERFSSRFYTGAGRLLVGAPFLWPYTSLRFEQLSPETGAGLIGADHGSSHIGRSWGSLRDPAFARVIESYPAIVSAYGLTRAVTILCLAWLVSSTAGRKKVAGQGDPRNFPKRV
jgi:hypothetical protein